MMMRRIAAFLFLLPAVSCSQPREVEPAGWRLIILGIAQDGGMPHLGCTKPPCSEARAGRRPAEKVSCLGLTDGTHAYLFDATPDMPAQIHALTGGRPPDGIFLTHAHLGHYTGLLYLGKETLASRDVKVYGTHRMGRFLMANGPWRQLIEDGHIDYRIVDPDSPITPPGGIKVTAISVPHREEFTDTVGYLIEGPRRKALFIPDIDKWEKWDRNIRELADQVDLVFLDGSFSSPDELPGRDLSKIPHPMMTDTRERLRGARAELWFIHLNHSNPALIDGKDVAREGMEFEM